MNGFLKAARDTGKDNLMLIIETICSTGIRVSEIKYITVESVGDGKAEIFLKGKIRTILIPNKLCHKLRKFAQKNKNNFRRNISFRKRKTNR